MSAFHPLLKFLATRQAALVWSFPPDQGQPSHATCCADVTPAVHCYAKARCYLSFDEMPCLMPLAWRRPL